MNSGSRAIRAKLLEMGPRRIESYIRKFDLYEDEARYIIEHEARHKSIEQIAAVNNVSSETVKRRRRSGFRKIADQIKSSAIADIRK